MKGKKEIAGYICNAVFGYISFLYVYLSYAIMTNTGKGDPSEYFNPEGESIRFMGVIMLFLWGIVFWLGGMLLKKTVSPKLKFWKQGIGVVAGLCIKYVVLCFGV